MVQISVRNVDEAIFKKFKAAAADRGLSIGEALNIAMKNFSQERSKKRKLTDFKPESWGPGTERLSQEIDDILYGGK